jgi:hypothetical protein
MTQAAAEFWMVVVGLVAVFLYLSKDVIGVTVTAFIMARHQRKMLAEKHGQEIALQIQSRQTATAANDLVATLMADPELARKVTKSLQVQLDEHDSLQAAKRQAQVVSSKDDTSVATSHA